ncbi:lantibiotic dehydratase C-terminal domain-containing protein [Virgibacillus sp.]|uniref:lantibiotic dehydratase C-terminal domain-containing protein n=1 Tax=Virgibacillus sp. TaxID=1872700 RepID=UPI00179721B3|nr:lantibiotic dehydratase C-terminal domain-containing protein [Virgibacillus sp.]NWO15014.1 hypothetical protein [Virgibacillus sp.]
MSEYLQYNWVYYRIYPGTLSKLDSGVEKIITPAKAFAQKHFQLNQWFFIRYMDTTGAHLRLRFHVRKIDLKDFLGKMNEILKEGLQEISENEPVSLKRLVPYYSGEQVTKPKIEQDLYEPELKKYINRKYLNISEALFESSSELVCSVCSELNRGEINRYELGSLIMGSVFKSIGLQYGKLQAFLQNYFNYWSGSEKTSYQLIKIAQQKKDIMESILSQDIHQYGNDEKIFNYIYKLKTTLVEVNKELGEESFNHLLFHYTHMMNNRLGIWPIEEAYLSALMLRISQDVPAQ